MSLHRKVTGQNSIVLYEGAVTGGVGSRLSFGCTRCQVCMWMRAADGNHLVKMEDTMHCHHNAISEMKQIGHFCQMKRRLKMARRHTLRNASRT